MFVVRRLSLLDVSRFGFVRCVLFGVRWCSLFDLFAVVLCWLVVVCCLLVVVCRCLLFAVRCSLFNVF